MKPFYQAVNGPGITVLCTVLQGKRANFFDLSLNAYKLVKMVLVNIIG